MAQGLRNSKLSEEKLNLLDEIKKEFACGEKDVNAYSPLALAYIGDDVYDVIIRTLVVERPTDLPTIFIRRL